MVLRWGHPPSLAGWSSDADHIVMGLEFSPVIMSELIQQINMLLCLQRILVASEMQRLPLQCLEEAPSTL
jgi:hypothetical protein